MQPSDLLTRNGSLKLAALVLAVLLWSVVKAEEPTRVAIPDIPIEIVLRDPAWVLAAPPAPAAATVVFSGPVRELVRLAVERPRVIVPIDQVRDSMELRPLRTAWVSLDGNLPKTRTEDVRPGTVLLFFEPLATRSVPVAVRTRGALRPGYTLAAPLRTEPRTVEVSGPAARLEAIDSVPTRPLPLADVRAPSAISVPLDTSVLDGLAVSPRTVDVYAAVVPEAEPADTAARRREGGRR